MSAPPPTINDGGEDGGAEPTGVGAVTCGSGKSDGAETIA